MSNPRTVANYTVGKQLSQLTYEAIPAGDMPNDCIYIREEYDPKNYDIALDNAFGFEMGRRYPTFYTPMYDYRIEFLKDKNIVWRLIKHFGKTINLYSINNAQHAAIAAQMVYLGYLHRKNNYFLQNLMGHCLVCPTNKKFFTMCDKEVATHGVQLKVVRCSMVHSMRFSYMYYKTLLPAYLTSPESLNALLSLYAVDNFKPEKDFLDVARKLLQENKLEVNIRPANPILGYYCCVLFLQDKWKAAEESDAQVIKFASDDCYKFIVEHWDDYPALVNYLGEMSNATK